MILHPPNYPHPSLSPCWGGYASSSRRGRRLAARRRNPQRLSRALFTFYLTHMPLATPQRLSPTEPLTHSTCVARPLARFIQLRVAFDHRNEVSFEGELEHEGREPAEASTSRHRCDSASRQAPEATISSLFAPAHALSELLWVREADPRERERVVARR
jgi:hypothetical protein